MAKKTLQGYEAIHMIRKGQAHGVNRGDSLSQAAFIRELFEVAISQEKDGKALFFVRLFGFLQHSLI
jgi:hypothetical protein